MNGPNPATIEGRFWPKVDKSGGEDACWPWLAWVNPGGFGKFSLRTDKPVAAHRLAYELVVGPVPDGLVLDHLCHTADPTCLLGTACPHRRCCNPAHLEPVTRRENVLRAHNAPSAINARKVECLRGHALSGDNLILERNAHTTSGIARQCRTCRQERARRNYLKRRAS